jgi:hypothetical protein
MNKPELVLKEVNGILRGECSLCPESVFSFQIEPYDQALFESAFRLHLEQVHESE